MGWGQQLDQESIIEGLIPLRTMCCKLANEQGGAADIQDVYERTSMIQEIHVAVRNLDAQIIMIMLSLRDQTGWFPLLSRHRPVRRTRTFRGVGLVHVAWRPQD